MKIERVLVEAGAGCGKTTSIIDRFLRACKSPRDGGDGLQPDEIVLLTFTDAAANEMRQRLAEKAVDLNLSRLHVSTFHAYCFRILKKQLPSHIKLLSDEEAFFSFKNFVLEKIYNDPAHVKVLELLSLRDVFNLVLTGYFTDLHHDFESLKNQWTGLRDKALKQLQSIDLEDLPSTDWPRVIQARLSTNSLEGRIQFSTKKTLKEIEGRYPDLKFAADVMRGLEEAKIFTPLLELFEVEEKTLTFLFEFIKKLQSELPFYLTFDRLEKFCLEALQKNPSFVSRPKLLIVDEFQDTSPTQWQIIEKLSGAETSWYLVGDPKQSIYAFRKADLKVYSQLKKSLALTQLDTNYRSSAALLNIFNHLQHSIFNSEHDPDFQELKAAAKEIRQAEKACRVFERPEHSSEEILKSIHQRESELPGSRHGVLFREWKKLYEFANYLHSCGIPYDIIGSEDLLDHPMTSLFLTFLSFLKNQEQTSKASLSRLASRPLDKEETQNLIKERDVWKIFHYFIDHFASSRWPRGNEWAAAMEKILLEFSESTELSIEYVEEILQKNCYGPVSLLRPGHAQSTIKIILMTVHGSKGLEFDCLYLPDPRESIRRRRENAEGEIPFHFPIRAQLKSQSLYFELGNMQRQIEREREEKRLFYVAFTRAKSSVDFFVTPEKASSKRNPILWFKLWNLSSSEAFKWSSVIRQLRGLEGVEWIEENAIAQKDAPKFELLSPVSKTSARKEFISAGVTDYLKKQSKKETPKHVNPSDSDAQSWGTEFHKALEFWDGRETTFNEVLDLVSETHRLTIKTALQKLRTLKELQFYWQEFEKPSTERQLYRESNLIITSDAYELSGTADALLFSEKSLCILDWKSSSATFQAERIKNTREQLRCYAEAFKNFYSEIRLFSVGIEYKTSQLRILVDEKI